MKRQLQKTTTHFLVLFGLLVLVFLVLALAQWGSGSSCRWQFPKWFGCVLHDHDSLAAGLIGAAGALFAAWIAWTTVQRQLAEQQRQAKIVERVYISGGGGRTDDRSRIFGPISRTFGRGISPRLPRRKRNMRNRRNQRAACFAGYAG